MHPVGIAKNSAVNTYTPYMLLGRLTTCISSTVGTGANPSYPVLHLSCLVLQNNHQTSSWSITLMVVVGHANRRTSDQLSFEGSWILLLNNNSRKLVPITDCSDSKWVAQTSRRCPYCPESVSMICSGPVVRSHQTNLIWINGHMPSEEIYYNYKTNISCTVSRSNYDVDLEWFLLLKFMCKYCIFTMDWTLRISYVHIGMPTTTTRDARIPFLGSTP